MIRHLILLVVSLLIYLPSLGQDTPGRLFLSADSVVFVQIEVDESEYAREGHFPVFCHQSSMRFATNSSQQIREVFTSLDLTQTNEISFCGYDYEIRGYREGEAIFKVDYNADCHYATIGSTHFTTRPFDLHPLFEAMELIREVSCEFNSAQLLNCYEEAIRQDERTELLKSVQVGEFELYYQIRIRRIKD